MSALVAAPIVLPLIAAALSVIVGRSRSAQRVISLVTLVTVAGLAVALLLRVDDGGTVAVYGGGWPAPMGISLVADRLAAIMLCVSSLVVLTGLVYAMGQPGAEQTHVGFHPLFLVLSAGVALAFLTGDLFNLFVAFEVTLMASYVLITLGGRRQQVRAGMTYVVISLVASTLFLTAVALIYSATGTVNMADLSGRIADLPDGVREAFALLLLIVFGTKAALFPLYFWLPDSYPTAAAPVTAVLAGLLTKVGVYAIIRTQTLLFPEDSQPGTLVLVVAGATMLIGVLGAIAQDDVKRILSFHIVSQIGYMVMGLGLFTVAGIAGALFYIVHHIIVKTTLFLTGGLVEQRTGTRRLERLGGLLRTAPLVAVLFALPALSLAGIPPLSGFVAKLALVEAGLDEGRWAVVAVSLLVSLLTLYSMSKIWSNAFWGEPVADGQPEEEGDGAPAGASAGQRAEAASAPAAVMARRHARSSRDFRWLGGPPLMVVATAGLTVLSLVVALAAGPLYELSTRAATDLVDPSHYVEAVLGP